MLSCVQQAIGFGHDVFGQRIYRSKEVPARRGRSPLVQILAFAYEVPAVLQVPLVSFLGEDQKK